MDIDLSKVIGYSRDSLQSRALMRSIMLDLYPGKTREMNVLLDVYESGVPRKIKNDGNITDAKYAQYVQKIVDDYGMQEQWAVVGLNAWLDVCLGNGTAASIKYRVSVAPTNGGSPLNGNVAGGSYTNPIVHNNFVPAKVKGNVNEYEIIVISSSEIEIKKFVGFEQSDMQVPNVINGKQVVSIGAGAYQACSGIKRLSISPGIKTIKANAFAGCLGLTDAIIGEGTIEIETRAFQGCSNLKTITLPTSLRILGKKVGYSEGYVFSGSGISEINLPNDIRIIETGTFAKCLNLERVYLPDNLNKIGEMAFFKCMKLKEISMPSTLKNIDASAFEDCAQLLKVNLNEGLTNIGQRAFAWCGFTSITIPSTVVSFGSDIFMRLHSTVTAYCYPGSKGIGYARLNKLNVAKA